MASKDPEEAANTATEEETLAFKKKRARRVSFADVEVTSVHVFKRDEDYETPPEPQATPEAARPDNEVLGFFRDLVDSDDSRESSPNLDDDVIGPRKSFLRPLGSPSPGSISAGSATSNDGMFFCFCFLSLFVFSSILFVEFCDLRVFDEWISGNVVLKISFLS